MQQTKKVLSLIIVGERAVFEYYWKWV
jgi:hypothetical protein